MALERAAMRAYVTGADHLQYTQLADGMVQLNATHSNLKQYVMELRLDLHSPISEVKRKLYTHNGSSISHMELHLQDETGKTVAVMADDERPLGFYSPRNGWTIHVVDTDPYSLSKDGGLDDVSQIQKYRMSDEDYDKRKNTLRAWKKQQLEKDPNFRFLPENRAAAEAKNGAPRYMDIEAATAHVNIGDRCEMGATGLRGTIKYKGEVPSLGPGAWVGILLDEPFGKGNGSRGGVTYFEAADKYGAFQRPDLISIGDFPEEDLGDLLGGGAGGCACGHDHGTAEHKEGEEAAAAPAAPAPAAAAPAPAVAAPKVTSLQRVGGRRADDDDDDESDSEL